MVDTAPGRARSPGREIWLLEMPLRVLRLGPVSTEEAEGAGHPITISGTELERFITLRAITRRVTYEVRTRRCSSLEESCETRSKRRSFWEEIKENPIYKRILYWVHNDVYKMKWSAVAEAYGKCRAEKRIWVLRHEDVLFNLLEFLSKNLEWSGQITAEFWHNQHGLWKLHKRHLKNENKVGVCWNYPRPFVI